MYYYLVAGYVAIAILSFVFSGVFGVPPDEKVESVALGAAFWPLIGFGFLGDLADGLRVHIAQKALDRANRPKKIKETRVKAPSPKNNVDSESGYREMDCRQCGHTLALRKSA